MQPIPFSLSSGLGRIASFPRDVRTLYRRARYGWAPRDVWSLDYYLNGVLAGALVRLAESTHGAPYGYPYSMPHVADGGVMRPYRESDNPDDVVTDFARWSADLRRWAIAFQEASTDEDVYLDEARFPTHESQFAEVERRYAALHQTLAEMMPWWQGLWD